MKTVMALVCALGMTSSLWAQDFYNASIRQAKNAVNKTEAASNQSADGQPPQQAAPPAQAPQPMNPALVATLQNIASLRVDLSNLNTNTPASEALTNDLAAAATGTKASAETIAKLAGDLQAAVAGNPALRSSYQKLAQSLHAVANGSHLTPAQFQMISDDVEQILENGGASYEATTGVLNDIKHLARETK